MESWIDTVNTDAKSDATCANSMQKLARSFALKHKSQHWKGRSRLKPRRTPSELEAWGLLLTTTSKNDNPMAKPLCSIMHPYMHNASVYTPTENSLEFDRDDKFSKCNMVMLSCVIFAPHQHIISSDSSVVWTRWTFATHIDWPNCSSGLWFQSI